MTDVSRDSWTIQDYAEELHHLREMDELPWIDKRIEMLKNEIGKKFSIDEIRRAGLSLEDIYQ